MPLNRHRNALAALFLSSAAAFSLTLATSGPAFASDAPRDEQHDPHNAHGHGHRAGHEHHANAVTRALALTSLTNAQRAQVESLAREEQATRAPLHAARNKMKLALAAQVERGAIDRSALAPVIKEQTDAVVAAHLRARAIGERLHTILTAKQCEEVGGGKDFLPQAQVQPAEAEIRAKAQARLRAKAQARAGHMVDTIEKKVSSASPEERARIAEHLRKAHRD